MRIFFAIILLLHGLIHLLGVVKAFGPASIPQFSRNIYKPEGALWLLCVLLLLATFFLYLIKNGLWPSFAIGSVILSQFLISLNWKDAKYGTLANLFILGVALSSMGILS